MPLWFSLSLSFALAWFLVPVLAVLALPGVPWQHRCKAAVSFLSASPRGILVVPVALIAPLDPGLTSAAAWGQYEALNNA